MNHDPWGRRRGVSIPLVVIFASVLFIMLTAFTATRSTMTLQYKKTMGQVKAFYVAKAGIQHALLKLRILPNESYQAGALSRGLCPFFVSPQGNDTLSPNGNNPVPDALEFFMSDLHSEMSRSTPSGGTEANPFAFDRTLIAAEASTGSNSHRIDEWYYKAAELRVLSSFRKDNRQVHAVEIVVDGFIIHNIAGKEREFKDRLSQVVEVARDLSSGP